MRMIGSTMEVSRGEVFTINRSIVDSYGVPYALSKSLKNPYLIISISSNIFEQDGQRVRNYWLSLKDKPSFDVLTPVFIKDLATLPPIANAIYYTHDGISKQYWYRYSNRYLPYEFRFSKLFVNSDTKEWIEGIYQYQFKIASGQLSIDWLTNIFKGIYLDIDIPHDKPTLAKQICKIRPDLLEDVDWTAPLVNFTTKDILKRPAKMIVK